MRAAHVALARRKPWFVHAALLASTAALLATSAPASFEYSFIATPVQVSTTLDADAPTRVYRVTFQANALGPEGVVTTRNASAAFVGPIAVAGLTANAPTPFVAVGVVAENGAAGEPRNVLTEVSESVRLSFAGDCATFSASPCRAVVFVDFSRTDGGASGGEVSIDWSLTARSSAEKPSSPDVGPVELPWTISVEEL